MDKPAAAAADVTAELLFDGPKAKLVRTMKMVSIANLSFAIISSPILYAVTSASGAPAKGIAMSALLLFFGGGTTAALTWATRTYVKTIHSIAGRDDAVNIVTPTFFGQDLLTQVSLKDIVRPDSYHPFATFLADGRLYYVDELGEMKPALQAMLEQKLNDGLTPPDGDEDGKAPPS